MAYVRFARLHPALYRLMFGAFPDKHCFAGLVEAGDRLFALLDGAVGAAAGRPARAVGCWALVHGLAMLVLDDQLSAHLSGVDDDGVLAVVRPFVATIMGAA